MSSAIIRDSDKESDKTFTHPSEKVQKTDYNLSLSQFVNVGDKVEHRAMNAILADLTEARIAREKADNALEDVLTRLKLDEKQLNTPGWYMTYNSYYLAIDSRCAYNRFKVTQVGERQWTHTSM